MKQKLALSCALIHKTVGTVPRRADDRRRPGIAQGTVGDARQTALPGITIRIDALYGRGVALRPDRADPRRPVPRYRHPKRIIEKFGERLWAVSGDRMPAMLKTLRRHPQITSAFAFGDTHHATPDATLTEEQLAAYLTAEGYRNLRIEAIEPGIEDCYMKLGTVPMNDKVIETKGLTKRFGSFTAVDHISFEVGRGEIFDSSARTAPAKRPQCGCCALSRPTEAAVRSPGSTSCAKASRSNATSAT